MGIVIPLAKMSPEDYVEFVKTVKKEALSKAAPLIDATKVVVRPLRPRDLGINADEWVFNVNAGENEIVNHQLDDKTAIVIYGIYNLSANPVTNEVKFGNQARTIEDVYIEDMYMYDQPAVILEEPITFQPGSTVIIKAVAKAANTSEKLGFLGFVIEPAGRTITGE